MKKVETKRYGLKNLLRQTPIDGTDELFIGEISCNNSESIVQGIIDCDGREVVSFGELHEVIGTRIVNDNIVIIDCEAVEGAWDMGWASDYGSLLLLKHHGKYKLAYNSNASVMLVTGNMLFGANYCEASDEEVYNSQWNEMSYPVRTFEYDYKKDRFIKCKNLGEVEEGYLEEYFNPTTLPPYMYTLRRRN